MRIILGISGSIAAYKAAALTRLWIKSGHEVRVVMTAPATTFITPLTLSTVSKHPVITDISTEQGWNNHVELGLWADAMVIAPASANTLARMANGLCDNMLLAVYLSARCPVWVAPAMDLDMWKHPATRSNLDKLQSYGVQVIPVGHGELASGLTGDGRMAEPEEIVRYVASGMQLLKMPAPSLKGIKALVTAGPTHEPLDPVRFIGNHSSGKMGIAIAEMLALYGAEVTLVCGPGTASATWPGITVKKVQTAQQMYEACAAVFPQTGIAVLAAAVADYRPEVVADQKIKKKEKHFALPLARTVDIAATLGQMKKKGQLMIGFALETNDEEAHATDKLKRKNFDFIVLNSTRDAGATFGHDTNKITILHRDGRKQAYDLKPKTEVAWDIVREISFLLDNPPGTERV